MVEVGEVRQELAKDLQRAVVKCVNSNKHLTGTWWIFITSKWTNQIIQAPGQALATKQKCLHTPLFVMNILPPEIASGVVKGILIEVNNQKGLVEVEWNLPADIPLTDMPFSEQIVETVYKSAQQTQVPILG